MKHAQHVFQRGASRRILIDVVLLGLKPRLNVSVQNLNVFVVRKIVKFSQSTTVRAIVRATRQHDEMNDSEDVWKRNGIK